MATAMPKPVKAEIEPEQTDGWRGDRAAARLVCSPGVEATGQSLSLLERVLFPPVIFPPETVVPILC